MSNRRDSEKIYDELIRRVKKIRNIGEAEEVLRWDQQVMMPEGGTPARSRQLSTLSTVRHDLLTDEEVGKLIEDIDKEELSDEKRAVLREISREYKRATRLPTELVEDISKTSSEAFSKWVESKDRNDFSIFAPLLTDLVELKKKYAEHIDPDSPPYQVLFEDYEPYLSLDVAQETLKELRDGLVPFLEEIKDFGDTPSSDIFERDYSETDQERFIRSILEDFQFEWNHARLDTAPHPFTAGTPFDVRITTRFGDNFLDSLLSTIHEFGHASYTLGLPQEEYGTPLGESRGLTFHESQSRLWENHIGRSRPFWEYILPKARDSFSLLDVSAEELYGAVNRVQESNLIRVEADELTYHMHIVLRFEIENDLFRGNLEVEEIPGVWNEKMEKYLAVRPEKDSEGCLQDVHWSHGMFGYFPIYSLGSVLAAQIFDVMKDDFKGIERKIRDGEFGEVRGWLTEKIHRHGKRFTTDELIRRITCGELATDNFLDYIKNKYGDVYNI